MNGAEGEVENMAIDRVPALFSSPPPVTLQGATDLILYKSATPPAELEISTPKSPQPTPISNPIIAAIDFRNASPRQIANISLDLYAAGILSYEDYTALAFQPELHPDYDRTVGALTGKPASPDQQRDYVEVWNERLRFDLRHNPQSSPSVKQAARIYKLLKGLGQPIRLNV